jgi:hypothetical protein
VLALIDAAPEGLPTHRLKGLYLQRTAQLLVGLLDLLLYGPYFLL